MEAVEQLEAEEEALRRELRSLEDLAPAPYNPRRISGEARTGLEKSLASFGDIAGIVWNTRTGNLVCGHQRLVALRELARAQGGELRLEGSELVVPSGARFRVRVVDWPALREKQANIAANSPHIAGEFDDGLQALLEELEAADAALFADLRFDQFLDDLGPLGDPTRAGSLTTRFGVPPFSVLDTRQGYWMDRRQEWLDMGIASGAGREENLTFSVSAQPPAVYALRNAMRDSTGRDPSWEEVVAEANKRGIKMAGGTSVFDPVLAEIAVRWFCPPGGTVLDPFAGGSVRGIVTGFLGRQYVGIDVRPEQIEANEQQLALLQQFKGERPSWIVGDSCEAPLPESCDLVFSCPPYADLEVYSDDPRDISNMDFDAFMDAYRKIIARAVATLREDRFAVFVVGDVRDKEGRLRNLPALTVQAFEDAGATFYNDGIILNNAGSAAIRAGGQFQKTRKLARVHQYFLVFVKGDGRRATEAVGDVEFGEPEPEETAA